MIDGANLRRATAFHAVASAGGITAAARILGKSPPAVHSDLKRFQHEIGTLLVERVGRSMRLTPAGRHLYEVIDRALDAIERAQSHIRSGSDNVHPMRLGAVTGFGRYRLAPNLYAKLPPSRPIEFLLDSHEVLLSHLLANRLDIILTYRAIAAVPLESELVAREELILVSSSKFGETMPLATLEQKPAITYDEYEYVFATWFAATFNQQPKTLRRLDHCLELEEALQSVAQGRGYTIAPKDAVLGGPWSSRLTFTRIGGRRCENNIFLCGTAAALRSEDAIVIRNILQIGPSQKKLKGGDVSISPLPLQPLSG